jgi:hypothetical protein
LNVTRTDAFLETDHILALLESEVARFHRPVSGQEPLAFEAAHGALREGDADHLFAEVGDLHIHAHTRKSKTKVGAQTGKGKKLR